MIDQAEQLGQQLSVSSACQALGVPRSSLYRARQPQPPQAARPRPERALSEADKAEVRTVLNSDRFQDCAPRQVYATLLDEDQRYLCHWRTMYRILESYRNVSRIVRQNG